MESEGLDRSSVPKIKKCNNCKAINHSTKECPLPKKRVKSNCRVCGSGEHRGNKCPNKQQKEKKCTLCKEPGHVRKFCQKVKSTIVL